MEDKNNIFIDDKQVLAYRINRAFSLMGIAGGTALVLPVALCLNYFSAREVTAAGEKLMPLWEEKLTAVIDSGDKAELNTAFDTLAAKLENIAYLSLLNERGELLASWAHDGNTKPFDYKTALTAADGQRVRDGLNFYAKYTFTGSSLALIWAVDIRHISAQNLSSCLIFYILLCLALAITVTLCVRITNHHCSYPLSHVYKGTVKILDESDLTIKLPVESNSEFGQIAVALNVLTGRIAAMLASFKQITHALDDVTRELASSGAKISGGSRTIQEHTDNTAAKMQELSASFAEVSAKLRELTAESERGSATVYQMGQINREVFQNVTAMNNSVAESTEAMGQMTKAIDETAALVGTLTSDITGVNAAMQRLSGSIAIEEKSAGESLKLSKEVAENAAGGMLALTETIKGISQIASSSKETAQVIGALGQHAMDIGNILHVIDDITKQTSLLALNAAIISAQAGEHGRGFAVIADEIGALAGHTSESTQEIATLITTIQDEAQKAVAVMTAGEKIIQKGADLGARAQGAFNKLKESADKTSLQAADLAKSTMAQAEDVKSVIKAAENITVTVKELSLSAKHQAREAEAMNLAAGRMSQINDEVARSSEEQAKSADEVLKVIEHISAAQALVAKQQEAQAEGTTRAAVAVKEVDKAAQLQNEAALHLSQAIGEINGQIKILTGYVDAFKI